MFSEDSDNQTPLIRSSSATASTPSLSFPPKHAFQHLQIRGQDETSSYISLDNHQGSKKSNHITQQNHPTFEITHSDDHLHRPIPNMVSIEGGASSLASSIVNLLNTVAGSGMLGLPAAYAGSGYVGGTVMMLLAAFFSANGLQLLSLSADTARTKFIAETSPNDFNRINNANASEESYDNGKTSEYKASFYGVAQAALPEFTILIDFAVAVKCFGVATGYFITVADCMVKAFVFLLNGSDSSALLTTIFLSRHFWVIMALVLVLPISFFKTLDSLKFTSFFSLVLIYSLALGIVCYAQGILDPCPHTDNPLNQFDIADRLYLFDQISNSTSSNPATCHGATENFSTPTKTLSNLPIFVFSFTCHQNIFSIWNELSNRTHYRITKVISTSILSALFLYFVVAIEGYRTFGNNVSGDILLNYPQTIEVTMMRIGIAIMVILSYPLQLDPSRKCVLSLISEIKRVQRKRKEKKKLSEEKRSAREMFTMQMDESSFFTDTSFMDLLSSSDSELYSSMSISSSITGPIDESPHHDFKRDNHYIEEMQLSTKDQEQSNRVENLELNEEYFFYVVTCLFLLGSFCIAMLISDLGLVLAIVGATGSTMVSYILPGAIYIKLHSEQKVWNDKWKGWAYIQLFLGFAIVPTALYFVLFDGASA